jgi:hypothetical protein
MKPPIAKTKFGSITIGGKTYAHDVVIRLDGAVEKRQKRLSKAVYGTSHVISLEEAHAVHEPGAQRLIVGTGQTGLTKLSDEAAALFLERDCKVDLAPTPEALRLWNEASGATIGLFHVTC